MKKIYPLILILGGSFLEIYYYIKRFTQDGTALYVSIIISVTLTALLTYCSAYYKNKKAWLIIVPLALYSIICTSGGQTFDLGITKEEQTANLVQQINKQEQIKELQNNIDYYRIEINRINEKDTITNSYNAKKYAEVLEDLERQKKDYEYKIAESQKQINDLRLTQTQTEEITTEDETNIYKFYRDLVGFNPIWTQYILQTILSIFIALSAPIGFVLLKEFRKKESKPEEKKPAKINITKEKITLFVAISWAWKRQFPNDPAKSVIVPFEMLQKNLEVRKAHGKNEEPIIKEEWKLLFNILKDNKIVDNNGTILYNGKEEQITRLLNKNKGRLNYE